MLRHKFIQTARKNEILRDVIERSLEYRSRLHSQQNSDSDHDSDADSNSGGNALWDYPTLKSPTEEMRGLTLRDADKWERVGKALDETVDNVATIKVLLFSKNFIIFCFGLRLQMSELSNFKTIHL